MVVLMVYGCEESRGDEFIKQIAHFEDFLKEYPTRPESIASWSVYNHRYKKSFWEHLSEPEQQEKLRMFNEAMLCISRVNNEIYLQGGCFCDSGALKKKNRFPVG